MGFEIIAPQHGTSLFTQESRGFPAIRRAMELGREALVAQVRDSGLRELAGNFAPVAETWLQCIDAGADEKFAVARAMDAEPEIGIQRTLLEQVPLAVLEGLWISAFAVGAQKALVAVEKTSPALAVGVAEIQSLGGQKFGRTEAATVLQIEIVELKRTYVVSEDTAIVQMLEGKPAMAARVPSSVTVKGYRGYPTVVHSAETLVNLARYLNAGSAAAAKVFQLGGVVRRPGFVEVPFGTTLRAVIFDQCGGVKDDKSFKFALVGGAAGGFLPATSLDIPLDPAALRDAGATMGTGSIVVGDESSCPIELAQRCLAFTTHETCGRCVVCREGSYQLKEILSDMTCGKSRGNDEEVGRELATALRGGSLCAIGRDAPNPLLSVLRYFSDELDAHLRKKRCPALVCKQYVTFHILAEKCIGCEKCLEVCPEDAIDGEEGMVHVIDPKACTRCGLCLEVCPPDLSAVVKAGAIKPQTPKKPIPVGTWKKR